MGRRDNQSNPWGDLSGSQTPPTGNPPPNPPAGNPWGDNSLTGGHLDTAEAHQERRDLGYRYQNMGAWRRGRAGVANILSAIPGARHLGVENISNPEDLDVARRAKPWLSGFERTVGHATPYAMLPASWMSTLPRSMTTGAVVEGADAAIGRENPYLAAALGAFSAVPGGLLNRAIAPRRVGIDERIRTIRERGERLSRRELERREVIAGRPPPARIPPEAHDRIINTISNTMLGGLAGHGMFNNAAAGAALGLAAPWIARRGTDLAAKGINRLRDTSGGQAISDLGFRWWNRAPLSPENQAVLNILGLSGTQELLGGPQIPRHLQFDPSSSATGR